MSYGIFLGYRLAPGGKWNGQYIVADLSDFSGMSLNKDESETECYLYPHNTEQVVYGVADICFPLKPKYDRVNLTFEAQEEIHRSDLTYDAFGKPELVQFGDADVAEAEAANPIKPPEPENDPPVDEGAQESIPPIKQEPRFFIDAAGRKYPADEYGNKIIKTSTRPPEIDSTVWGLYSKTQKKEWIEWKKRQTQRIKDEEERTKGAAVPAPDVNLEDDWGYTACAAHEATFLDDIDRISLTWRKVGHLKDEGITSSNAPDIGAKTRASAVPAKTGAETQPDSHREKRFALAIRTNSNNTASHYSKPISAHQHLADSQQNSAKGMHKRITISEIKTFCTL